MRNVSISVAGKMSESKAERVKLKGIEGKALLQLVEYVYTAQIEITEENVQALLPAASLLEVCTLCQCYVVLQMFHLNTSLLIQKLIFVKQV